MKTRILPLKKVLLSSMMVWIGVTLAVSEVSADQEKIIQNAKNECISASNGKFYMSEQAVILRDLTGDGKQKKSLMLRTSLVQLHYLYGVELVAHTYGSLLMEKSMNFLHTSGN